MQMTRFAFVTAVWIGLTAPSALAAQGGSAPGSTAQESDADAPASVAPTSTLPVSIDRIRQRLAAIPEPPEGRRNLINLSYYVDVYARAPALEVLQDFDLDSETVAYGSPTHAEMLEASTPREWRPRAISIGNLFRWR